MMRLHSTYAHDTVTNDEIEVVVQYEFVKGEARSYDSEGWPDEVFIDEVWEKGTLRPIKLLDDCEARILEEIIEIMYEPCIDDYEPTDY